MATWAPKIPGRHTTNVREKDVEALVDRLMAACGFRAIRFSQARATMQTPGIPDRRYVHETLALAIWYEMKRPGGKWSTPQQAFAAECERLGELYVVGTETEAYAVLRALGCYDGMAIRPQGWREHCRPGAMDDWRYALLMAAAQSRLDWA
jgi:hypothetical protein